MRKCSTLEVSLGSQYTLSVEMPLDRFGQTNTFWMKSLEDIQVWVLWRSSRGRLESTSQGSLLECQIKTTPGRHFRTSPRRQIGTSPERQIGTSTGRQIGMSPGRLNRFFRGRPRNVLWANICLLVWFFFLLLNALL